MSKKKDSEAPIKAALATAPQETSPHTIADCHTSDGQLNRTFTKEIHGEKFAEFAKEFAAPRGMEVRYR